MRTEIKDGNLLCSFSEETILFGKQWTRLNRKSGVKISKGTVGSLRKALHEGDQEQPHKLLNPAIFRAGRKTVLSKKEQHMIFKTAIFDSERGRA